MKNKSFVVITVVCVVTFFVMSALILYLNKSFSEKDFFLEANLDKSVFNVGETIYVNVTITNRSGRAVSMSSNGQMPCVFFYKDNDKDTVYHFEVAEKVDQTFSANEKITRFFEYRPDEKGTYILDAHYSIVVNDVTIQNKLGNIIIEVL